MAAAGCFGGPRAPGSRGTLASFASFVLALALTGCPENPVPDGVSGPEERAPLQERSGQQPCQPLDADGAFAPTLQATGCFDADGPVPGMVPFSVRSPLWTDGALKQRWLALPVGSVIGYQPDAPWAFPEGAVLAKNFLAGPDAPVETRLMVLRGGEWRFASYRWVGAEAELLDDSFEATVTMADGSVVDWYFPRPDGCTSCHAGGEIGPVARQLDTLYDYGDGVRSQLEEMARVGLFDTSSPPAATPLTRPDDADATVQARARSWLQGNCAHCHRPGGWTPPEMDMDLRSYIPLAEGLICDVPVQFDAAPEAGAWRIRAGDSEDSAIWGRVRMDGARRMPPSGINFVDPLAQELLPAWIDALEGCPE